MTIKDVIKKDQLKFILKELFANDYLYNQYDICYDIQEIFKLKFEDLYNNIMQYGELLEQGKKAEASKLFWRIINA